MQNFLSEDINLELIKEQYPPYSKKTANNFKDDSGKKIGHFTVLYRTENNPLKSRPRTRYVCLCDCGNIFYREKDVINKSNKDSSCGKCSSNLKETKNFNILETYYDKNDGKMHYKAQCKKCGYIFYPRTHILYNDNDYPCVKCNKSKIFSIGDQLGELTIIDKKVDENNQIKYLCKCSCGTELLLTGTQLHGRKTCGNHFDKNDIIGKKFGKLTVLSATDLIIGHNRMYECQCDCGTKIHVSRNNLISGHTQSCGCIRSRGEEYISKLLKENNINFEKNKTFPNFYRENPANKSFFDFYLPNEKYAIEFDGQQHFLHHKFSGWFTKEHYDIIHQRDLFKNKYCEENNIPLIRIPYWELDNLTINDLQLNTSKYIYTKEKEQEYYQYEYPLVQEESMRKRR